MSTHVLLNLSNELGKSNKLRGLPKNVRLAELLSLFCNEFDKFNNTGAQMLDSIYNMTLKLFSNHTFGVKASRFCNLLRDIIMDVITLCFKICKPLVVYQFYCMALYHSQTRHHVIKFTFFFLELYYSL